MGILSSDRFEEIINNSSYKNYDCFIETGTYTGRSIIPLAKKNPKIKFHTIEIVQELYLFAKDKANEQDLKNIEFHLGDSVQILEKIIKNIKSDHLIIFLDAHSSSYEGFSAETIEKDSNVTFFSKLKNKLFRREKKISTNIKKNKLTNLEVPLIEELKIISNFEKNFLIIIDDFDLFEKKFDFADWQNINENKIKKIFSNKNCNFKKLQKRGLNSPQLIVEIKLN
jgi:hypothetical protein